MVSGHAKTTAPTRRGELPDPMRVTSARVRLVKAGQKIVDWARDNGENPNLVQKVLSGQRSCMAGASRRIAVKLDIVDRAKRRERVDA